MSPDDATDNGLRSQKPATYEARQDAAPHSENSGPSAEPLDALARQMKECKQRSTRDAIELGLKLDSLKEKIGFSRLMAFAEGELDLKRRAVDKLIILANALADRIDTVSYMPVDTLHRLLDRETPDDVRSEVFRLCDGGTPPNITDIEIWITSGRAKVREPELATRLALKERRAKALKPRTARARRKKAKRVDAAVRMVFNALKDQGYGDVAEMVYFFRYADRRAIRQVGDWLYVNRLLPCPR